MTLAAAALTNVLYPSHYKDLIALSPGASQLVVARDGIVAAAAAAAVLLVSLWQVARAPVSADAPNSEFEGGRA